MRLRDLTASGIFRILFLVWGLVLITIGAFMLVAEIFFPEKTHFNFDPSVKLFGAITFNAGDGIFNYMFLAFVMLLHAVITLKIQAFVVYSLAQHTKIGDLKVSAITITPNETFD